MAKLTLEKVSVDFPIFNARGRSLKSSLFKGVIGGAISNDSGLVLIKALKNVTTQIKAGDRVALLGHNGAGKSTLLRVMAGIYEPTGGKIETQGKITSMFDPSLGVSQEQTGYDNITTRGILLGLDSSEIGELKREVAKISELGDFLNMPLRAYSAGMRLRLAFSVSTTISPEILLLDEAILAGDAGFIQLARKRLDKLIADANVLVLASHSQRVLKDLCNRGLLISHGEATEFEDVDEMIDTYIENINAKNESKKE